jgi:uncharacterized protein YaaW (UPF0174 family)
VYITLQNIYAEMIGESVASHDFMDYGGIDFPEVSTPDEDQRYQSITPDIPNRISLRDYNRLQIEELKKYFRSKMNQYKDISDDDMKQFLSELITKKPEVVKKARLHIAAKMPDIFNYT